MKEVKCKRCNDKGYNTVYTWGGWGFTDFWPLEYISFEKAWIKEIPCKSCVTKVRKFARVAFSLERNEWLCEDIEIKQVKEQIVKDRMFWKLSQEEFEKLQKEMLSNRVKWKHLFYESELPDWSEIFEI